jgi:hypothetical protein
MDIKLLISTLNQTNGNISLAAKTLGISRTLFYKQLKNNNLSKQKLNFNHHYFESIDSEDKAYFLGYLMADGCISEQKQRLDFGIHTKDKYILEVFKQKLYSVNKIRTYKNNVSIINHTSRKMILDLKTLGCTPRKSLTLKFPILSEKYKWDFIRGYFDGDGCATNHGKPLKNGSIRIRINFIGTKEFLTSLQNIFNTNYKLILTGNNKQTYKLEITSKSNLDYIISNMYDNATIFLLRKRNICINHIKKVNKCQL